MARRSLIFGCSVLACLSSATLASAARRQCERAAARHRVTSPAEARFETAAGGAKSAGRSVQSPHA